MECQTLARSHRRGLRPAAVALSVAAVGAVGVAAPIAVGASPASAGTFICLVPPNTYFVITTQDHVNCCNYSGGTIIYVV
jgi:hypothetical protein